MTVFSSTQTIACNMQTTPAITQSSSIYQCVCSNNFRVHTKWIVFCSISKCPQKCDIRGSVLQFEALLSLVSSQTFLSWSLWQWRCLNLWGPSSSIPMTALYLMSLKMHALLAWKNGGKKSKDGKPEVKNQLSWNRTTSLGEGKHYAHWGTELLWREGEWGHICC